MEERSLEPPQSLTLASLVSHSLYAGAPEEQRRALAEGILRYDRHFLASLRFMASQTREADDPERLPRLWDEAIRLYLQWLLGAELLGWEDEPDRRTQAAHMLLEADDGLLTAQDQILRGVAGELREMTGEQAANLLEQVRLDIPDRRARFHFEEFAHNLRSATPDRSGTPTTGRPGLAEVQVRQEG